MNKAGWTSQSAAIAGILLVGVGFWWRDSIAAALISLSILYDGWRNLRQVIADLMDESPTVLGRSRTLEALPERLREAAQALEWVESAGVRLRDQGRLLTGEVFVVPRDGAAMSAKELLARAVDVCHRLSKQDWRLHGISVVPVSKLDGETPPMARTQRSTNNEGRR